MRRMINRQKKEIIQRGRQSQAHSPWFDFAIYGYYQRPGEEEEDLD